MELSGEWDPTWADQLQEELSGYPGKLHVVMLHGMVSEYGQGEEGIALRDLRGRGIDYLALGHGAFFPDRKGWMNRESGVTADVWKAEGLTSAERRVM